jgi:hypothetical protein
MDLPTATRIGQDDMDLVGAQLGRSTRHSPTVLVNEYHCRRRVLYHVDAFVARRRAPWLAEPSCRARLVVGGLAHIDATLPPDHLRVGLPGR